VIEAVRAPERPKVYLVEDNPADAQLLALACEERGILVDLRTFNDGDAILKGLVAGLPAVPDLLIVDINLPRMPGQTVIEAIRSNPALGQVRIAVLTTSRNPKDRVSAQLAGADSIYIKPNDWDEFCELVSQIMRDNLL
jgi:CheY-like chemotaxis protein